MRCCDSGFVEPPMWWAGSAPGARQVSRPPPEGCGVPRVSPAAYRTFAARPRRERPARSEVEAGLAVLDACRRHRVDVALAQHDVVLGVHLDLGAVLGVEQHTVPALDL